MVIFWTLIILWIVLSVLKSARYAQAPGRRGRGPIFIPGPGGGGSGGGGWSGGSGGGGFSGGGGSFGGGGASGGW